MSPCRFRRGLAGGWCLLDDVDREEEADPDHVDEVPVVGHDDRGHGLLVGEAPREVGAAQHEEEGDQPAGHVQAVEPGGQVEHRAVGRARDGHALVDQLGVLQGLTADEDGAHDVGEDEPLAQAPLGEVDQRPGAADLPALGGEDAPLAGERRGHEDRGVGRRERHVEQCRLLRPEVRADRADGEVGREQRSEEHELAGEPDDRAHADHAGSVVVPVQTGGRNRRCCCRHPLQQPS